tara:strand:+ start:259 stop:1086 length:828 start_codon:yes stop_codon:yes gene_type:complete
MFRFFFYIILIISLVLPLTKEQLDAIKDKTEDINLPPSFTLNSIRPNDFPQIKEVLIEISSANELYKKKNNLYSSNIILLINSGLIDISEVILLEWDFILAADNIESKAISKDNQITLIYNLKEDSFSFMVSDESALLVEKEISLENLRGQVVLINFWATWCGPCRMEIPDLNELYKKYKDLGLEILGVSTSDSKTQLKQFINAYNMFYPVLYGKPNIMNKIQMEYGVRSIPMSILLNKRGEVVRVYQSAILKQYDPRMYADLIIQIENALKDEY